MLELAVEDSELTQLPNPSPFSLVLGGKYDKVTSQLCYFDHKSSILTIFTHSCHWARLNMGLINNVFIK
jgi:hypothetical protein